MNRVCLSFYICYKPRSSKQERLLQMGARFGESWVTGRVSVKCKVQIHDFENWDAKTFSIDTDQMFYYFWISFKVMKYDYIHKFARLWNIRIIWPFQVSREDLKTKPPCPREISPETQKGIVWMNQNWESTEESHLCLRQSKGEEDYSNETATGIKIPGPVS